MVLSFYNVNLLYAYFFVLHRLMQKIEKKQYFFVNSVPLD